MLDGSTALVNVGTTPCQRLRPRSVFRSPCLSTKHPLTSELKVLTVALRFSENRSFPSLS